MALVEIANFTSRSEAGVAAAALRACGVPAVTFDDGAGGAAYTLGLSGEGFRVFVPEEVSAEAADMLAHLQAAGPNDD